MLQIWRADSDLEGLVGALLSLLVLEGLTSLDVEVVFLVLVLSPTSVVSAFLGAGLASSAASSVEPPSRML